MATRVVWARCTFGLLGPDTSRTLIKHWVHVFELGDSLDVLVGVVEVVVTGVTQPLVPQESFSGSTNLVDGGALLNEFMEGQAMELLGNSIQFGTQLGEGSLLITVDVVEGSFLAFRGKFGVFSAQLGGG